MRLGLTGKPQEFQHRGHKEHREKHEKNSSYHIGATIAQNKPISVFSVPSVLRLFPFQCNGHAPLVS